MKAFLVAVSSLCVCSILLCFLAYATGKFPFVPRIDDMTTEPQQVVMQTPSVEPDPLCSPCVERIALMLEMVQEWEAETVQFAQAPTSQSRSEAIDKSGQVKLETEEECSPCEEKRALILEMIEKDWEADMTAFLEQSAKPSKPAAQGWVWLSSEQREQAQQLDQYGPEEGLRRLRESDPEAARQFDRKHSRPAPDEADDESLTQ